jgi:hypothetical protein
MHATSATSLDAPVRPGFCNACLMQPIGLHADHFHHLASARDQFGQALTVGVGERAWFGTNAFSEQRDDLSIERVGLGEPPGGAGKIADLTWIDDRERQAGAGQSGGHGDLEPAGGLEHNQCRSQGDQIGDELRKGLAIARDNKDLA